MAKSVRMGFVGLGWWSNMLATAASGSRHISITACTSRSAEKRDAFVARFGGEAKETFEELAASPDVDALVLTTPNSVHASQCIAAARQGKHIFIEKPMALTVDDCNAMIAEADRAGVILAIGQNKRRMTTYRKVLQIVQSGGIGDIVLVEAHSSSGLGIDASPDKWRWFRSESPGGPLTSHTIHHADLLNLLLGVPTRITGFASKVGGAMEADDVVAACLQFRSGALAYLGGSFMSPNRKYCNILGTEGVIFVDEDTGTLSHKAMGAKDFEIVDQTPPDVQTRESLAEEMNEFAECILEGRPSETDGHVGRDAVAVIEAIVRSAESGAAVELAGADRQ